MYKTLKRLIKILVGVSGIYFFTSESRFNISKVGYSKLKQVTINLTENALIVIFANPKSKNDGTAQD